MDAEDAEFYAFDRYRRGNPRDAARAIPDHVGASHARHADETHRSRDERVAPHEYAQRSSPAEGTARDGWKKRRRDDHTTASASPPKTNGEHAAAEQQAFAAEPARAPAAEPSDEERKRARAARFGLSV